MRGKTFLAIREAALGKPELARLLRSLQGFFQREMAAPSGKGLAAEAAAQIIQGIGMSGEGPLVLSIEKDAYALLLKEFPKLEAVLFSGSEEEATTCANRTLEVAKGIQEKIEASGPSGQAEQKSQSAPVSLTLSIESFSSILRCLSNEATRIGGMAVESSVNEGVSTRYLEESDDLIALHVNLLRQLRKD